MVTLEQLSTTTTSPLPKTMTASSNVSSLTQIGHEKRHIIAMTTSFIKQQRNSGMNDLMHELSKQLAEIVKAMI